MRPYGVVLEHQRDIAPLGRHHDARARNLAIADPYLAVGRVIEACKHLQGGRLAAARGAEQGQQLALGQLQIDAAQNLVCAIVLGKTFDANCPSRRNPAVTAPRATGKACQQAAQHDEIRMVPSNSTLLVAQTAFVVAAVL